MVIRQELTATERDKMINSIENYRVIGTLGKGGFATVKKAIRLDTGETVAIKMIKKDFIVKNNLLGKVLQELEIHSRLQHDSILGVLGGFEGESHICIVLEYCRNGDLERYLKRHHRGCLSEPEASTIVKQILDGLLYLQRYKILHRDFKLANILLTENNRIKIADFGLSTQLQDAAEIHVTMCGTPNYISPEVAAEAPHGMGVDVWGLGVLFYTLLFGKAPFQTPSIKSTLSKVRNETLKVPESVSPEADDLLHKLLEKNPKKRITAWGAWNHPFFEIYPDTPLKGVENDSGLGGPSLCDCDDTKASFQSMPTKSHSHGSFLRPENQSRSFARPSCSMPESSHSSVHPGSAYLYRDLSNSNLSGWRTGGLRGGQSACMSEPSNHHSMRSSQLNDERLGSQILTSAKTDGCLERDRQHNVESCYISTERLSPIQFTDQDGTLSIKKSGEVVFERPSASTEVNKYYVVTRDQYLIIYKSTKFESTPPETCDRHHCDAIPSRYLKVFNKLAKFVRLMQSRTIKLTMFTKLGVCVLMESSPHHFSVSFKSGVKVDKRENLVTVTRPGRLQEQQLSFGRLLEECPETDFLVTFMKVVGDALRSASSILILYWVLETVVDLVANAAAQSSPPSSSSPSMYFNVNLKSG